MGKGVGKSPWKANKCICIYIERGKADDFIRADKQEIFGKELGFGWVLCFFVFWGGVGRGMLWVTLQQGHWPKEVLQRPRASSSTCAPVSGTFRQPCDLPLTSVVRLSTVNCSHWCGCIAGVAECVAVG